LRVKPRKIANQAIFYSANSEAALAAYARLSGFFAQAPFTQKNPQVQQAPRVPVRTGKNRPFEPAHK
jgi:hypothetical protein